MITQGHIYLVSVKARHWKQAFYITLPLLTSLLPYESFQSKFTNLGLRDICLVSCK